VARVAGVEIPNNKRSEIALTYIFGVGRSSAKAILTKAGIDLNKKVKDLSEDELDKIRHILDAEYETEGTLRSAVRMNIKRLMDIGCYRGIRHRRSLPCRGQRTRTNARTRKGPRKTIANKKKAPSKG
jgi:small subunit ribosomal protein S13